MSIDVLDLSGMTKARKIALVVQLEMAAEQLKAQAVRVRDDLAVEARRELAGGVQPQWAVAGVATVSQPVTKATVAVGDLDALIAWFGRRNPDALVTRVEVRPASLTAMLTEVVRGGDGVLCLPEDGEVVPGLVVQPGGQPKSLSIRRATDMAPVLVAEVEAITSSVLAALTEEVGADDGPAPLAD